MDAPKRPFVDTVQRMQLPVNLTHGSRELLLNATPKACKKISRCTTIAGSRS
jgi:hypothetical protein